MILHVVEEDVRDRIRFRHAFVRQGETGGRGHPRKEKEDECRQRLERLARDVRLLREVRVHRAVDVDPDGFVLGAASAEAVRGLVLLRTVGRVA